jgi:hypothetical protein
MPAPKKVIKWLLSLDPAISWQARRDLAREPEAIVAAERARVAAEGWGARLLALQAPGGHWGGAEDKGWMTTVDALALLKELGLAPDCAAARTALGRVHDHITWHQLDGRSFFEGETEPCINGRILAAGAYFGTASDKLVDRLLGEQLEDGGWNCEAPKSRRSSFHSTICVLEGLLDYEKAGGPNKAVTEARRRAEGYLLDRRLFRSLRSGEVIDRHWLRFAFTTAWHYDVLRGLDYLRKAGVAPDARVDEAVDSVRRRQHQNGRWPLNIRRYHRIPFEMEAETGRASGWNTLRALRVLDWHEEGRSAV